ncbi:hypothetical protein [Clostridium perfringens]|uniref:hypothetical protein n=1 Tax=Clostridium perfringens TaxID=1502 RepID=UPI00096A5375|nr:hypothetical protein [Clostridium perfringens]
MITQRDYTILRHMEMFRAISLKNVAGIYFQKEGYKDKNYAYKCASRRMKALENMGIVLSYINSYTQEKIYYTEKKVSPHDLFIQDFWRKLLELDFNVLEFNTKVNLMKGQLKPDAFIEAEIEGIKANYFLEVDLNHYTNKEKIVRYEMFYKSDELKKLCENRKPCLVITRPTHRDIRYTSNIFDIVYTDLKYTNLEKFLFE